MFMRMRMVRHVKNIFIALPKRFDATIMSCSVSETEKLKNTSNTEDDIKVMSKHSDYAIKMFVTTLAVLFVMKIRLPRNIMFCSRKLLAQEAGPHSSWCWCLPAWCPGHGPAGPGTCLGATTTT